MFVTFSFLSHSDQVFMEELINALGKLLSVLILFATVAMVTGYTHFFIEVLLLYLYYFGFFSCLKEKMSIFFLNNYEICLKVIGKYFIVVLK